MQLEDAQGGKDEEAAAALAQLKDNMAALARAEEFSVAASERRTSTSEVPDEVQLASVLDRLDARLGDLEAEIDGADDPTKAILQTSAQLWLGGQVSDLEAGIDDENGPISRPDIPSGSRPALRGSTASKKPPEKKEAQ